MIDPALRRLAVPIDSVEPHPRNDHHQGDVGAIVMSLRRFGQVRPIVVQKSTGYVVAGNHVLAAMKAEGEKKVAALLVDLSDEDALGYLIADNRTAELATYDDASHAAILTELREAGLLEGTGYDEEDVGRVLADLARDAGDDPLAGDPDDAPPIPETPVSKFGEVYEAGPHRIMCGDATDRDHVAALMNGELATVCFTDPPYGVAYSGAGGRAVSGDLGNVAITGFFPLMIEAVKPGGAVYLCGGSANLPLYFKLYEIHCRQLPTVIVWDKGAFVLRHHDYHSQYEVVFYGWTEGGGKAKDRWFGDRKQSDVWSIPRDPSADYVHPTQKPVELSARAIRNSSPPGGIVLDPFGGSGSTLIAAHRLERRAFVMESDPRYCDVIRARYEAAALNVPTTVGAPS